MIVKGPILIADIPDLSGEVLDEETIRKAALIIARNGVLGLKRMFFSKIFKTSQIMLRSLVRDSSLNKSSNLVIY